MICIKLIDIILCLLYIIHAHTNIKISLWYVPGVRFTRSYPIRRRLPTDVSHWHGYHAGTYYYDKERIYYFCASHLRACRRLDRSRPCHYLCSLGRHYRIVSCHCRAWYVFIQGLHPLHRNMFEISLITDWLATQVSIRLSILSTLHLVLWTLISSAWNIIISPVAYKRFSRTTSRFKISSPSLVWTSCLKKISWRSLVHVKSRGSCPSHSRWEIWTHHTLLWAIICSELLA